MHKREDCRRIENCHVTTRPSHTAEHAASFSECRSETLREEFLDQRASRGHFVRETAQLLDGVLLSLNDQPSACQLHV